MPSGNAKRKLKQGRLPFSPVDQRLAKKRKISEEDTSKVPCPEVDVLSPDGSLKSLPTEALKSPGGTPGKSADESDVTLEEKENLQSDIPELSIESATSNNFNENSHDSIEILSVLPKPAADEIAETTKTKKKNVKKNVQATNAVGSKSVRKKTPRSKERVSSFSIDKMFKTISEKKGIVKNLSQSPRNPTLVPSEDEIIEIDCNEDPKNSNKPDSADVKDVLEVSGVSEIGDSCSSEDKEEPNEVDMEKSVNSLSSSPSQSQEESELCGTDDGTQTNKIDDAKLTKPLATDRKPAQKRKWSTSRRLMQEEKIKQRKLELERLKKEKNEDRQKELGERKRKKIEEQELKDKEKEDKRIKREEDRLKKEEEKQKREESREEERQKRKEEKQKKEEERIKKEEEKELAKEEEREKKEKLKAKFVQFFVPKKTEVPAVEKEEVVEDTAPGNFILFQVKDNMKVAPLVRCCLSVEKRKILESVIDGNREKEEEINYLKEIKKPNYRKGKWLKTFPPAELCDDDCAIISEEDEEDIDGTNVFVEAKSLPSKSKVRTKLLQFCENSRPAYYGTWSKMPSCINGRKPFHKEEIFDYDYDSDEDWEEVENGESLSDSDGEGDDPGEELNQYEVDNEFFVPHGYLSDGEGEENEEEYEETEKEAVKDDDLQKQKLKQKQEEFDLEMKQKTKQLKPKVFGCVWLGDKSSHKAYDQLLKILNPHRAITMFSKFPVDVSEDNAQSQELEDEDEELATKFVKSFPEKAVPDLIRMIHGNRYGKLFLIREFSEYWKKNFIKSNDEDKNCVGFLAMRKVEPKIQEIGQYGKFSEDGVSLKYRTWYVSKEVRKKYGLENLSLHNSWEYTLSPKERKREDSNKEERQEENDEQQSKSQKKTCINLITKFTKVLHGSEEKKLLSQPLNSSSQSSSDKDALSPPAAKCKVNIEDGDHCQPCSSSASPSVSGDCRNSLKKVKKKRSSIVTKEKMESPKPRNSIVTMFNKSIEKKHKRKADAKDTDDSEIGCITLD